MSKNGKEYIKIVLNAKQCQKFGEGCIDKR